MHIVFNINTLNSNINVNNHEASHHSIGQCIFRYLATEQHNLIAMSLKCTTMELIFIFSTFGNIAFYFASFRTEGTIVLGRWQ